MEIPSFPIARPEPRPATRQTLKPAFRLLLVAATCLLLPGLAVALQVTLHPVADATLIEASPNNSSGGADFFNAGTTQNRTHNRALLRFDPAAVIPADATITSASLTLAMIRQPSDGYEASVFGLHRLLWAWGEGTNVPSGGGGGLGAPALPGDATWTHRFANSAELWSQPGGAAGIDYVTAFSSSCFIQSLTESPYLFESTLDTVADVQGWLAQPQSNYGWMLMTESEDLPFTARKFASRENSGLEPSLTIDYVMVPEPGSAWLLATALLGGWVLHKTRSSRKSESSNKRRYHF